MIDTPFHKGLKELQEQLATAKQTNQRLVELVSYISNKQDEAWLDAIAKQWNTLTGKAWETKDDIEANVTALFEQLTEWVNLAKEKKV